MKKEENQEIVYNEFKSAIETNDLKKIKKMIEQYGVSYFVHFKIGRMSTLCAAIDHGNLLTVKCLIENGWNINETDSLGDNALYYALMKENKRMFLYLIEKGIDINQQCITGHIVFMDAVEMMDSEYAEILYKKGIDMNIRDNQGKDFLHYMVDLEEEEMKIWIECFLQEPERFDEELLRKIKAKRLELLV